MPRSQIYQQLLQESTHFTKVQNNDIAPEIAKGDIVFLREIPLKEFVNIKTGFYMALYIDGRKEFFLGHLKDGWLRFHDVLSGKPKVMQTSTIRCYYRVMIIHKSEDHLPLHHHCHFIV